MALLLSTITQTQNYPRHGYKQNKHRLVHHGTIVKNSDGLIPIPTKGKSIY